MGQRQQERVSVTFMSGPLDGKTVTWKVPENGLNLILTIGRREGCEIMLDYDSQVSRTHARVIYDIHSKQFSLEDSDSRNGTYISTDGDPRQITTRTPLERGQLFRVGRTWLRVDPIRARPEQGSFLDELAVDELFDDEDDEADDAQF